MFDNSIENVLSNLHINATSWEPYGSGHINDTYKVETTDGPVILQKINTSIFKDTKGMKNNIIMVTKHLESLGKNTIKVLAWQDPWRVYSFIENSYSIDVVEDAKQAYTTGKAFGEFQNNLVSLDATKLVETIPNFHNTVWRLSILDEAVTKDEFNRLSNVKAEMDFVNSRRHYAGKILDLLNEGKIPVRTTHNDTKINNVLFDKNTDEALAVIDLDTVMPGCALYDFGDMVRTATAAAEEDEKDLIKVYSKAEYFEELVKGYLSEANFLNKYEIENIVFSGILITFTIGIRFLSDYLMGDVYFKTRYDDHNLVRAKTQFKMVESIENQYDKFNQIVHEIINQN